MEDPQTKAAGNGGSKDDEVRIYASDRGHTLGANDEGVADDSPASALERCRQQFADMGSQCREKVHQRPFTAMALASVLSAAVGVLVGMKARHSRWHWH